jgi:hypothetical protein
MQIDGKGMITGDILALMQMYAQHTYTETFCIDCMLACRLMASA